MPGPPGQGGLPDLATLIKLSWEPTQNFTPGQAFDQLQRLIFQFDRPLRPDEVKERNTEVTVVWFRPTGFAPVSAVRCTTNVDGDILLVTCAQDDVKRAVGAATTGTFVIDVNCDVVLDQDGQPASSCSTGLIGRHLPRPGGILRTWLLVRG